MLSCCFISCGFDKEGQGRTLYDSVCVHNVTHVWACLLCIDELSGLLRKSNDVTSSPHETFLVQVCALWQPGKDLDLSISDLPYCFSILYQCIELKNVAHNSESIVLLRKSTSVRISAPNIVLMGSDGGHKRR